MPLSPEKKPASDLTQSLNYLKRNPGSGQKIIFFTAAECIQAEACWLADDFTSYTQIILSKVKAYIHEDEAYNQLADVLSDALRNIKLMMLKDIPAFKTISSSMLVMVQHILEENGYKLPDLKPVYEE